MLIEADISEMNLSDLRSRLNMVVQDGTLCSGSLREALDMTLTKGMLRIAKRAHWLTTADDAEIYEALRRVHLLPDSIDQEVLKDNPFADLDTFVAVGTCSSNPLSMSLTRYRGVELLAGTEAIVVLGQSIAQAVQDPDHG